MVVYLRRLPDASPSQKAELLAMWNEIRASIEGAIHSLAATPEPVFRGSDGAAKWPPHRSSSNVASLGRSKREETATSPALTRRSFDAVTTGERTQESTAQPKRTRSRAVPNAKTLRRGAPLRSSHLCQMAASGASVDPPLSPLSLPPLLDLFTVRLASLETGLAERAQ